jgi:Na+/H+ antiporter NhaD/arsenite permease-like protein
MCLNNNTSTYLVSIGISQIISNVPCSILLSKFTGNWKALLLGVNIGGIGTLIASLASVISYKLYTSDNPGGTKQYLINFLVYSFLSLILFASLNYFLIR